MGTPPDRDDPQEGQGWQSSGWQSSWQQPESGQGWQQQQPEDQAPAQRSGWQQTADGQWVQTAGAQTSGKSTAALVLGILGLVLCPLIFSILALIFGYQARADIDRSNGTIRGRGNATAGIVLGWIGIAFMVLLVVGIVAFGIGGADTESTPTDVPTVLLGRAA